MGPGQHFDRESVGLAPTLNCAVRTGLRERASTARAFTRYSLPQEAHINLSHHDTHARQELGQIRQNASEQATRDIKETVRAHLSVLRDRLDPAAAATTEDADMLREAIRDLDRLFRPATPSRPRE